MPIAKKVQKPKDEKLLNQLPSTRSIEVPIGNNIYELYSLPKDTFMNLSGAIKVIAEEVKARLEEKQQEGLEAAKVLASSIINVNDTDVKKAAIEISNLLSNKAEIDPLELLFAPELKEQIDEILEVCLEGVDKEDKDAITADQLAKISEAIFLLNFLGFIRTIRDASYFFRS